MAVVAIVGVALAPAGAGKRIGAQIDVEKVVVGTPPPGTTYAVVLTCDDGQVFPLTFNGPDAQVVTVLLSEPGMICTVTEPGTGGASSVSFACADDPTSTECQSPNSIELVEPADGGFTITNTFDPSTPVTPATPVPGTPRFTG